MATTYYARGDSSTANNASLNSLGINKQPVVSLEFIDTGGGRISFDHDSDPVTGDPLPDPDTMISVSGGPAEDFYVEFTGTLPSINKLANIGGLDLRGEDVVVLTTESGERLFFLPSAPSALTMAVFPNGAIPIDNVDQITNFILCFAAGTAIATPIGDVPVEALRRGDHVLTPQGKPVPILWIHETEVSAEEMARDPSLCPVVIPRNTLGNGRPYRDLMVSPQHRIEWSGWDCELHFGAPSVLVRAQHLVPQFAHRAAPPRGLRYFHILCENHEMLVSNGLASESYQPSQAALDAVSARARADFIASVPEDARRAFFAREDSRTTLKRHEFAMLTAVEADADAA